MVEELRLDPLMQLFVQQLGQLLNVSAHAGYRLERMRCLGMKLAFAIYIQGGHKEPLD